MIVVIWGIVVALGAFGAVSRFGTDLSASGLIGLALATVFGVQAYALSRLSRWAVVSNTLLSLVIHFRRYAVDPNWADHYPSLGQYLDLASWGLTTALIVIHWRRMNWAPLGLPYRKTKNPVEVF